MPFLSLDYLFLFIVCFLLYYAVRGIGRKIVLLAASAVFIGWNHYAFLAVAVGVALFSYGWGRLLEYAQRSGKPVKPLYVTGIVLLVVCWILFHYAGAVLGLFGRGTPADAHLAWLIFPLGMSFYTFQALGYLTDIYWQEERAERNLLDFLIYMLLFLKFLSGPIERGGDLLPQLKKLPGFEYENVTSGLKLILIGMMKKLLISSYIESHTDIMFSSLSDLSGVQFLMTCLIYPIQLYADFSGYTDMAIGGARMFGIRLSPNFNRPFVAKSTADLWRRWHMSLSFWVRDYLYVPICAATRSWGRSGVLFSLVVTFVLLGLWHGIGWAFAVYGLIQGLIICWEVRFPWLHNNLHRFVGQRVAGGLLILRTYLLFALSLIFFRLASLKEALYFIRHISFETKASWKEINIGMDDHSCLVAGLALLLLFIYEYFNAKTDQMERLSKRPAWVRWSVYYVMIFLLFIFGNFQVENFIYMQF